MARVFPDSFSLPLVINLLARLSASKREGDVFSCCSVQFLSAVDRSYLGSILVLPSQVLSLHMYRGLTCSRESPWWAGFTKAFELQRTTANFFQKSC